MEKEHEWSDCIHQFKINGDKIAIYNERADLYNYVVSNFRELYSEYTSKYKDYNFILNCFIDHFDTKIDVLFLLLFPCDTDFENSRLLRSKWGIPMEDSLYYSPFRWTIGSIFPIPRTQYFGDDKKIPQIPQIKEMDAIEKLSIQMWKYLIKAINPTCIVLLGKGTMFFWDRHFFELEKQGQVSPVYAHSKSPVRNAKNAMYNTNYHVFAMEHPHFFLSDNDETYNRRYAAPIYDEFLKPDLADDEDFYVSRRNSCQDTMCKFFDPIFKFFTENCIAKTSHEFNNNPFKRRNVEMLQIEYKNKIENIDEKPKNQGENDQESEKKKLQPELKQKFISPFYGKSVISKKKKNQKSCGGALLTKSQKTIFGYYDNPKKQGKINQFFGRKT